MVEAAMRVERRLQRVLPRMAEGRMADVMRQAQRFGQVFVEAQRPRRRAADLRHLQAVGQADAEMIAVGRHEHLRLVAQAAEGDAVDDAVAVPLEHVAWPPHLPAGFGVEAARSEEHTSELQSLMRISYAVFCLKK